LAPAIVGMSGYGRPSDFERSKVEGFVHHFIKPIDPAELHDVLRELMERKAQP